MKNINRILIANRGEIAVRIQRTCRALGIETVALYTATDQNSLHVRLADITVQLPSLDDFANPEVILSIARETAADAIHPGYGFLAERADFIYACEAAGIIFIGPSAVLVEALTDKIGVLNQAKIAGFPVIHHSPASYTESDFDRLAVDASALGYPVVIKSTRGGRGRGERIVFKADQLHQAVFRAQSESFAVYGRRSVYLEKAILPAHQINVQILGDNLGQRIHLGEREGSILLGNQKLFEESPAPCLADAQRRKLWQMALDIADFFHLHNSAAIEFLVDSNGSIYFTEIKTRIQVEHPLTENLSRIDIIAEQIRLAAGEPLNRTQADIELSGWSLQCRLTAQDPWGNYLPIPGKLRSVRLPDGPDVRTDSFIQSGVNISAEYDPLLAKIITWAPDREICLRRLRLALSELQIFGIPTNQPLLQAILADPRVASGQYDTDLSIGLGSNGTILKFVDNNTAETAGADASILHSDLAVAAAVGYLLRNQVIASVLPDRLHSGWHRQSRRLE